MLSTSCILPLRLLALCRLPHTKTRYRTYMQTYTHTCILYMAIVSKFLFKGAQQTMWYFVSRRSWSPSSCIRLHSLHLCVLSVTTTSRRKGALLKASSATIIRSTTRKNSIALQYPLHYLVNVYICIHTYLCIYICTNIQRICMQAYLYIFVY